MQKEPQFLENPNYTELVQSVLKQYCRGFEFIFLLDLLQSGGCYERVQHKASVPGGWWDLPQLRLSHPTVAQSGRISDDKNLPGMCQVSILIIYGYACRIEMNLSLLPLHAAGG